MKACFASLQSVKIAPGVTRYPLGSTRTPLLHRQVSAMATSQQPTRRILNPALFICDIQEKFRPAIHEYDKVILTATKMLRAAKILSIPVYATTQNRARLGTYVSEILPYFEATPPALDADKTLFSMWTPALAAKFAVAPGSGSGSGPSSNGTHQANHKECSAIAIVGIESHICVTQTTLDALEAGHAVYVLADGVSSCNPGEVPLALARLRAAGAVITTSESFLYELMGDAALPEFRAVAGLVKETSADTKATVGALLSRM